MNFNMESAIKDGCSVTVAKAIMEKIGESNTDFTCDVVMSIIGMLSQEDKKWILNSTQSIITQLER